MKNKFILKFQNHYKKHAPSLLEHVENTANLCSHLAKANNLDVEKAYLAGWAHDLYRYLSDEELKQEIIPYFDKVKHFLKLDYPPIFFHGPLAAFKLPAVFAYHDSDVISAVMHHTVISLAPGPYEALLFIADKCEPAKNRSYTKFVLPAAETNLLKGLYLLIKELKQFNDKHSRWNHPNFNNFLQGNLDLAP